MQERGTDQIFNFILWIRAERIIHLLNSVAADESLKLSTYQTSFTELYKSDAEDILSFLPDVLAVTCQYLYKMDGGL